MKVTKTYSIESSVYSAFEALANEKNINKSSFIEETIKKFLKDNDVDYIDKLYSLKSNPNHTVSVISQDPTYYFLSDGSRIQKILFMQVFKESESINPNNFLNPPKVLEEIAEKLKNIKVEEPSVEDIYKFDEILDLELLQYYNIYNTEEYKNISKLDLCNLIININNIRPDAFNDQLCKDYIVDKLIEHKNSI